MFGKKGGKQASPTTPARNDGQTPKMQPKVTSTPTPGEMDPTEPLHGFGCSNPGPR